MNNFKMIRIPIEPTALSKVFLFCILIYGCKHESPVSPLVEVSADSCTTGITYTTAVSRIIETNCALSGCHVPSGFKDFSTYEALTTAIENSGVDYFLTRIGPGGGMPPDYSTGPIALSACDLSKLQSWLSSGYPL